MQSLKDAARQASAGYPGGLVAVCARFGWNYETTRKEVAGAHGFKLDTDKLLLLSQACMEAGGEHCRAILNAWNAAHGEIADRPVTIDGEKNLMGATVDLVRSSSNVLAEVTAARSDGQISNNERKCIERVAQDVIDNMHELLREVARENEAANLRAVK